MKPLGISDIISMAEAGVHPATEDHWYWCRQHERAEHVSELPPPDVLGNPQEHFRKCTRIGPFMSEREALRLTTVGAPYGKTVRPLGMEVET